MSVAFKEKMPSLLMISSILEEHYVKLPKYSKKKEHFQSLVSLLTDFFQVIDFFYSIGKALQNIDNSKLDQVIVTNSIPAK